MNQQPAAQTAFTALRILDEPHASEPLGTDAELLSVYLATGNRVPMEMLMRRYSPMVASVCRATVSDSGAAEDAYQATFLIFLKSARKVRKQASLGAWLHGVAFRTACRLRHQRRKLMSKHSSLDEKQITACTQSDPLAQIARQMELDVLDQEMQILPSKLRDPLVEHYLLGYTATEIAQRMELSTSAVEGRIRRGRLKLRSRLARRGVTLSMAVAAAGWFHNQVQAAETSTWFSELLHGPLSQWSTGSSVTLSPKPEVSSLVKGELNVFNTTAAKLLLATSLTLAIGLGAAIAFSPLGVGVAAGSAADDSQSPVAIDASPAAEEVGVLAQIAPAAASSASSGTTSFAAPQIAPLNNTSTNSSNSVVWSRPEGDAPEWFQSAAQFNAGVEENRKILRRMIQFDFNGVPLRHVLQKISDDCNVAMYINQVEFDAFGADVDSPVSLSMPELRLREGLILILKPLDLTYKIHESYIEITTQDNADAEPQIRYYDLSHILPGSANIDSLVSAIVNSCTPDGWLPAGGMSTISVVGSLMIVSCPEETHFLVEEVLANVAKVSTKNLEREVQTAPLKTGLGAMGGMF